MPQQPADRNERVSESQTQEGIEEAPWMMPVRSFINQLPGVSGQDRRTLHEMIDMVYAHGRQESAASERDMHDLRRLLDPRLPPNPTT